MGCDIHIVVEGRGKITRGAWEALQIPKAIYASDTGKWTPCPATERHYGRFAALAGVRGDGPEPKGFPEDAGATTCAIYRKWDGDAHSASWMELGGASKIFAETQHGISEFNAKYPESFFFGVDRECWPDVEEWRIVFWFDN